MVYKQTKVIRKKSQAPPIFIGPMMLHGDGKYSTYLNFFTTVNGALNGSELATGEIRINDGIITGSDEETAIVNAARTAFPHSNHLYCMLHCKDNVRHHLTVLGVPSAIRAKVLTLLFECDGISESANAEQQDDRTAALLQLIRQHNIDAVDYLQNRVLPKVYNNNRLKWEEQWLGQAQWTNNNCESMNHTLKVEVDWKPKRVTDLTDHLRSVVSQQYSELRRALAGLGDLQLKPEFGRHLTAQVRWNSMTEETKDKAFAKFMMDDGMPLFKYLIHSILNLLPCSSQCLTSVHITVHVCRCRKSKEDSHINRPRTNCHWQPTYCAEEGTEKTTRS